ncbi:RIP metalloprotease RseP [Dokdonia sp. Hel_I_63]|uniref:RIP metalloprotease RseP n=1 Tax=Dokdonia sp. Hel_I_63 TaxID=1249996 RepID=UPI0011A554DA|nr:RIP metalloprotease RseP [Dokdonia sp. Hel_I_63]
METFIQIAQFTLAISILVILHEFGHFAPARYFGIKVEKFFLFFDVKFALFKKKIGDTVYGIGWLPLGGYVKIAGMIDESMDKEQMAKDPEPWEFRSKPAWQRLIVMIGGVTVNVLLAWFIYSAMLVYYGDEYVPADRLKYGIAVGEVGEEIGLRNGDQVIKIDDKTVTRFDDVQIDILLGDNVTVVRDGNELTFPIPDEAKKSVLDAEERFIRPRFSNTIGLVARDSIAFNNDVLVGDKIVAINGNAINEWTEFQSIFDQAKGGDVAMTLNRDGQRIEKTFAVGEGRSFGVGANVEELLVKDEYSIGAAISAGLTKTWDVLTKQVRQFKLIFNSKVQGYKKVKGPIGIVEMMAPQWDWYKFWGFTAMFSVWLAFVNILPIPALDGGHVMFLLYEMISGKAPSEKTLERGQIIGFVIVMGLMVVIFGNDIWNLIKG